MIYCLSKPSLGSTLWLESKSAIKYRLIVCNQLGFQNRGVSVKEKQVNITHLSITHFTYQTLENSYLLFWFR